MGEARQSAARYGTAWGRVAQGGRATGWGVAEVTASLERMAAACSTWWIQ